MISVLVVDDSAVIRRVVRHVVDSEPGMAVVATAVNGAEAVERVAEVRPDVVTMDIEMPVMDGVAAVREIQRRYRRLPVIMFSTLTEHGARATLDAMAAGAADYVTKPHGTADLRESMAMVRSQLPPKIRALAYRSPFRSRPFPGAPRRAEAPAPARPEPAASRPAAEPAAGPDTVPDDGPGTRPAVVPRPAPAAAPGGPGPRPPRPAPGTVPPRPSARAGLAPRPAPAPAVRRPGVAAQHAGRGRTELLAIGTSTGGPEALTTVLGALPRPPRVPVVVVQHMPPVFTAMLAERLDRLGPAHVVEAAEGDPLEAGVVYIAPGGAHLEVRRGGTGLVAHISDAPPENFCKPSADVLFRSVAAVAPGRALVVVMTGMGNDGRDAAVRLHESGCEVIVQDQESSVVWGMPRAVYEAGAADVVAPLGSIAALVDAKLSARIGA